MEQEEMLDEIAEGLGFAEEEEEPSGDGAPDTTPDTTTTQEGAADDSTKETPEKGTADTTTKPDESGTPAETAPHPADDGTLAPKTWRTEANALWKDLPKTVKDEILKREEDFHKGIEVYKSDANVGRSFRETISQFEQTFTHHNVNPVALAGSLLQAHVAIAKAEPAARVQMLFELGKQYGVDLVNPETMPYYDPAISSLQNEIRELKSKLTEREVTEQNASRETLRRELDTFAADPANRYFEQVQQHIPGLLRSGVAKDLKDAYEQACWIDPTVRTLEQTRLQTEAWALAEQKADEEAKKAAKATAANVKTTGKSVRVPPKDDLGSIDDTLAETLAAINSRS